MKKEVFSNEMLDNLARNWAKESIKMSCMVARRAGRHNSTLLSVAAAAAAAAAIAIAQVENENKED